MRFLLKMFALGFIGLALLPAFAPEKYRTNDNTAAADAAMPSMMDLTTLLGEAAADVRGMCDRQPDVCRKGQELLAYTGTRAREGLVIAYDMFRHGHPSMQQDKDEEGLVKVVRPAVGLPVTAAATK